MRNYRKGRSMWIAATLIATATYSHAANFAVDNDQLPLQISTGIGGNLARACNFAAENNWQAVKDQIALLWKSGPALSPEEMCRARYLYAEAAYRLGDFDAMQLVEDYLEDYPQSENYYEALYMKGNIYFYGKEFGQALTVYEQIPDSGFSGDLKNEFEYRKAFSLLKTGYYERAGKIFKHLLGKRQYADAALFYDAYIDYVKGNYDLAYTKFGNVKNSSEQGLEAEYYINQIDFKRGEYRKVARAGKKLLASNIGPELRPETLKVTGLSYFKTGDPANAETYLKEYIDLAGEGSDTSALYALGTIYYDYGNNSAASGLFQRVTDNRSETSQSAWLYLGQIYAAEGNGPAAAIAFDRAADMSWDKSVSETALYNLAVAAAEGKAMPFADAAEVMEEFLEVYPDSPYNSTVSRYLSSAYYSQRKYEDALRVLDNIKNPDSSVEKDRQKILLELGKSQLKDGKVSLAVKSLENAAKQVGSPETDALAQLWLGEAYYAASEYAKAEKAYTRAINSGKLGADLALAQYDLGYAEMKLKDYSKALRAFQAAVGSKDLSASQQRDARVRIADCQYYTGDYRAALDGYGSLADINTPEGIYPLMRKADILGVLGDTGRQIEILQQLSSQNKGIWSKDINSRLAEAYSAAGDVRASADIYGKLLDSNLDEEEKGNATYALAENAMRLYEKGDMEAALAAYRKLETSGDVNISSEAVIGIMRTTADPAEEAEYAGKVLMLSGISPNVVEEAKFRIASLNLSDSRSAVRQQGVYEMKRLIESGNSDWAARAAVTLGEYYLDTGQPDKAEQILLEFVDSGTDDYYWLARGYIALADSYSAQENDYLARLYLETLRDSYPGKEKEIFEMINNRLSTLNR